MGGRVGVPAGAAGSFHTGHSLMILGLGVDLCDIRRIEAVIARHGARFIERIFTPAERARADRQIERVRAATYAKRFAAKEASPTPWPSMTAASAICASSTGSRISSRC
jgi:hypothetical protein